MWPTGACGWCWRSACDYIVYSFCMSLDPSHNGCRVTPFCADAPTHYVLTRHIIYFMLICAKTHIIVFLLSIIVYVRGTNSSPAKAETYL